MKSNIDIVKEMYGSFLRGDVPAILEHLSVDVEWEHDSVDHGIPWLTPRRGQQDVVNFFTALAALDITRFEPVSFLSDENHVAVPIQIEARVKNNGRMIRELEMHLWTFDQQRRVTRFRHMVDTHQHWLALHNQTL